MKKLILILFFLISITTLYSQTTYYWVGGTGASSNVSFTTNSKWNTALNGSGTVRAASDPTDILIVDGSNVGGATPTTGSVTATCGSTAFAQLILRNSANLTLVRPSSGTGTITVNGDASANDDLLINAGCSLTSTVADSINTTSGNNLLLNTAATGKVFGTLIVTKGASRLTVSNPTTGGACFFESGSTCKVNAEITYYPFGSSSGVNNAVVFNSGSTLVYMGGNCIFTSSSSFNPIDFKSGSTLRIESAIPSATVTTSNFFSGRKFANVTVGANQTVTGGSFYNMGNLTVESGSSFYLNGSGASPISGNITNNGTFGAATGFTSSNLLMIGVSQQTIGGSGTFLPIGALSVGSGADVLMNANLSANGTSNSLINGKLNFSTYSLSGTGTFQTKAAATSTTTVTAGVTGTYTLTLDATAYNSTTNTAGVYTGLLVTGSGIPANTFIIGTSSSTSTITLSNQLVGTVAAVTISGNIPVLRTSNANGIDGSFGSMGVLSVSSSTDYIYDAPTTQPFSIISLVTLRNVTFNATATTNRTVSIDSSLILNSGILSIRATDTIRIKNANPVLGSPFSASKYIALLSNTTQTGMLRIDVMTSGRLFPVGTASHYLPATITPIATSSIGLTVFEPITTNGSITGAALSPTDQVSVVNAVWKISRPSGSGDISLNIGWPSNVEGSNFALQTNARIGIIQNTGTAWGTPFGSADNTANTATGTITTVGSFSVGALPLTNAFFFNAIPSKTYGNPDFNCGATSLNTAQPIIYSSSNPSVATISTSGIVHIVGVGTTQINATQDASGTYAAANVTQTLIVNKATLLIRADDQTKFEGEVNPSLTVTYNGFVYNETESILLTPVNVTTTAVTASPVGTYPITPSGATAANYNVTFNDGIMNVLARQTQVITFNTISTVTYGATDIAASVSSTNSSIPVTLISSDNNVATVINNNTIHITGAGTVTITASQAGDLGHFPADDVSVTFTVNKAPLQVIVADTVKLEGQANPSFRFIYNGFVLGENESVLTLLPTVVTTANSSSTPGLYTITPESADAANYSFSYVAGRLTVLPADSLAQTLTSYYNGNGGVVVKIYSHEPDFGRIKIYDAQGRYLAKKDILVVKGFTVATLPLNNIANGFYVVSFGGKKGVTTKIIPIFK